MKVKNKADYLEKQRRRNAHRDRKKVDIPKPKYIVTSVPYKLSVSWFHPLMIKLARTQEEKKEHCNRQYTLKEKIAQLDARKEKK